MDFKYDKGDTEKTIRDIICNYFVDKYDLVSRTNDTSKGNLIKIGMEWPGSYHTDDQITRYCAALNSVHYIKTVLKNWTIQPSFLELQNVQSGGKSLQEFDPETFQGQLSEFKRLGKIMFHTILDIILSSFKGGTSEYFKKRGWNKGRLSELDWRLVPKFSFDLSYGLVEPFSFLKARFTLIQQAVNHQIFLNFLKKVGEQMNTYIFAQLLSAKPHYSKGGAHQFTHDMETLFTIFGHFTRSSDFFTQLKEVCHLLTLPPKFTQDIQKLVSSAKNFSASIEEYSIVKLRREEVATIISLISTSEIPK